MLPPVHLSARRRARRATCSASSPATAARPTRRSATSTRSIAGVNVIGRRIEELIERLRRRRRSVRFIAGRGIDDDRAPHARRARALPARHVPRQLHHRRRRLRGRASASRSHAAVTVDGRRRSTSTSPARRPSRGGAINASFSQTMSGVIYAVRCLVDPTIPMNEGLLPAVARAAARAASLVNPEPAGRVRRAHHQVTAARSRRSSTRSRRRAPTTRSRRAHSSTCTRSPASATTARRG